MVVRTQVLDILIKYDSQRTALSSAATPRASAECLVDYDTISHGSRDEGNTIGDLSPSRIIVECEVGEAISSDAEEERQMPVNMLSVAVPQFRRHYVQWGGDGIRVLELGISAQLTDILNLPKLSVDARRDGERTQQTKRLHDSNQHMHSDCPLPEGGSHTL